MSAGLGSPQLRETGRLGFSTSFHSMSVSGSILQGQVQELQAFLRCRPQNSHIISATLNWPGRDTKLAQIQEEKKQSPSHDEESGIPRTSFNQYTWPYGHNYLYSVLMQNILDSCPPPKSSTIMALGSGLMCRPSKSYLGENEAPGCGLQVLLCYSFFWFRDLWTERSCLRPHPATPTRHAVMRQGWDNHRGQ